MGVRGPVGGPVEGGEVGTFVKHEPVDDIMYPVMRCQLQECHAIDQVCLCLFVYIDIYVSIGRIYGIQYAKAVAETSHLVT